MADGRAGLDLGRELAALGAAGRVGDLADGSLLRRAVEGDLATAQAAFVALVERHGPMVLRVCRDRLGHAHDAEDAFQATFLVLARRAGAVRRVDSVASWLHGVAHRVASRARQVAARRDARERQAAALRFGRLDAPAPPDLNLDLHEALGRLPAKLRDPLILCYFEGLTADEAAGRLGCPRGTVLSRLARGRDRLRVALSRAAPVPIAGPALDAWLGSGTPVRIPPILAEATARASGRILAGAVPASLVAAPVAALLEGAMRMTTWTKLQSLGLVAAALAALAVGARAGLGPLGSEPSAPAPIHQTPPAPTPPPARTAVILPLPPRDELHQLLRRAATEAIESTRAEPDAAAWALTPIASAQARAGDRDGARATFEVAVRDAPAGFGGHRPAHSLGQIGHAQAEVGLDDEARATLRRASAALPERAVIEPELPVGVTVTNAPPSNHEVLGWFAAIARDQMRLGARADARATADRLDGFARDLLATSKIGNARDFYGPVIAATPAAVGDFAAAFGWSEGINTAGTALGAIALAAAQGLDREAARRFVAEAATRLDRLATARAAFGAYEVNLGLRDLAEAQARVGDIEAARRSACAIGVGPNLGPDRSGTSMTAHQVPTLLRVAQVQREAGDLAGARVTLTEGFRLVAAQPVGGVPDGRYGQLADGQITLGDFAGALRSLEAMAPAEPEKLAAVARLQAAAGEDAAARALFDRAIGGAAPLANAPRPEPGLPTSGKTTIQASVVALNGADPTPPANALGAGTQNPPTVTGRDPSVNVTFTPMTIKGELRAGVDLDPPPGEPELPPEIKARLVDPNRWRSVRALAEVRAMGGDVAGALEAFRQVEDSSSRNYVLGKLAAARATAGDVAGALRLALDEAKSPGERRMALQGLARGVTARLTTPGLDPKPGR